MPVTILITRPQPDAARFADQVRTRVGDRAEILCSPLLRIEPGGTLPDLRGNEVLIFTSRNGVAGFSHLGDRRGHACYAVGDATAEAAQEAGLRVISAGGNATALLARIAADGCTGPFLHLHGRHMAADVAAALRNAGHTAADAVVYDQIEQPMTDEARAVLAGTDPVILPLMSPRSARVFFAQGADCAAPLLVAALSRNVAEAVPGDAAHRVQVATTPDAAGILAVLHDLVRQAKRLEGRDPAQ